MAARVTGVPQLQARLHAIGGRNGIMRQIGLQTVREAKLLVHRKTGHTGRSIRLASSSATNATVVAGGAAAFLEFGTRPHEITPRAAQALRFAAKGVGTTLAGRVKTGEARRLGNAAFVFARVVHHPGTKPYPFLLPGARKATAGTGVQSIVKVWNESA